MSIETAGTTHAAIDSRRWPDVARVPSGPLTAFAAAFADRLLRRAVARLPLRLVFPDGSVVGAADPTLPTLVVNRPGAPARRVGRFGLIGFGESYMAGGWTSADLAGVLTALASSIADPVPRGLQLLRPIAVARQPRSRYNSPHQAGRNSAAHYDLSNELFAEFLDDTMSYSSAMFAQSPGTWPDLLDVYQWTFA